MSRKAQPIRKRHRTTPQTRRDAVEAVLNREGTLREVGERFGVKPSTLGAWVRQEEARRYGGFRFSWGTLAYWVGGTSLLLLVFVVASHLGGQEAGSSWANGVFPLLYAVFCLCATVLPWHSKRARKAELPKGRSIVQHGVRSSFTCVLASVCAWFAFGWVTDQPWTVDSGTYRWIWGTFGLSLALLLLSFATHGALVIWRARPRH